MRNFDQNGYLKDRYIGLNIRTICDVIEEAQGMEHIFCAFLDFEKAFDTVNREFLNICINKFGFPKYINQWIEILYNKIESSIINNGYTSIYFPLPRGVRQGCPLSALVFILVVECLASSIR